MATPATSIFRSLPPHLQAAAEKFIAFHQESSDAEFVVKAYQYFLGRGIDETGYNNWLIHLASGLSREELATQFLTSEEFKKATRTFPPLPERCAPNPKPERSSLEQYQDIWVRGALQKKGIRECADRFQIIKNFCGQFSRPFTVLDLGANLGYFSIRLAETFPCHCVAVEGAYGEWTKEVLEANGKPRVILLNKILCLDDLRNLARVEHFDVVLALSVVHHLDGPFGESLEVLRSLGDHLIIELPNEHNACGQQIVEEVKAASLPPDAITLGHGKSHLDDGVRPIMLLSRPKTEIKQSFLGTTRGDLSVSIASDFARKSIQFHNKEESRDWLPGINLQTYLWFNGIYPERPDIARLLEARRPKLRKHRDVQPWNVILSGDDARFIDFDDPNHPLDYSDEDYFNRLLRLLRSQKPAVGPNLPISKSEGIFHYLKPDLLPARSEEEGESDYIRKAALSVNNLLEKIGPFHFHFGGAGDALLLLSAIYDEHPNSVIVSFPNSIPAARSFFEAFPRLKAVYFLPPNDSPAIHLMLRVLAKQLDNCLGMGVTPQVDYFKEWTAELDIFSTYKVNPQPRWAQSFKRSFGDNRAVLSPQGSQTGMVGSKRNVIPPKSWAQLVQEILKAGYQPVILGVPSEAEEYPPLPGCEDQRSLSFQSQMEQIASAELFIGADSWGKSFAALAGLPTIVFDSVKGKDWHGKKDPSDHVFLDPWKNIHVVSGMAAFQEKLHQLQAEQAIQSGCASSVAIPALRQLTKSAPSGKAVKVFWEGSFDDSGSLSHVNRSLTDCLKLKKGIQISLSASSESQVCVRHAWPPNWKPPGRGLWTHIQPWEFGHLPLEWMPALHRVDEIWAPSTYCRQVYVDSGIDPSKVKIVPNGVDPTLFHPQATPLELITKKSFRFLFVGGTIPRKGADILLEAFTKAFSADDDVCLIIKDVGTASFYKGQTMEETIRRAQGNVGGPEIVYLNTDLPQESLPSLFSACHCLVHPYRGEGFGLPVLEAMAAGLPTIVTAGGATDDFATDTFAYRIPAQRRDLKGKVGPWDLVRKGWWLEPDLSALIEQMRWVFRHQNDARALGLRASEYVRANWTWDRAAAVAGQCLHELVARDKERRTAAIARRSRRATVALPPVAHVGNLDKARAELKARNFALAWKAGFEAIQLRPFHPEGWLLLCEVAKSADDFALAKRCAEQARSLAPKWKPAKAALDNLPASKDAKPTCEWTPSIDRLLRKRPRLTVCVITRNEERFIGNCLESVQGVADQIIVLDTGSTDQTVEIAQRFGAEVHHFAWTKDFSAARNAALEHAHGDWVLILDSDEELIKDGHEQLKGEIAESTAMAYRLPIVDAGREGEGASYVPRLFRNAPGVFFIGRIHEQAFSSVEVLRSQWGLENRLGKTRLLHHGYTADVTKHRQKVQRNLQLLELAIEEMPNEPHLLMSYGLELARSGDLEAALGQYGEAFELAATLPSAQLMPEFRETLLTQYSSQLVAARDFPRAISVLRSGLARNRGLTASMHFCLGIALMQLKQFGDAAKEFRATLAKRSEPVLSPINKEILKAAPRHCLGICLNMLKQHDEAEAAFKEAIREEPSSVVVKMEYARFLAQTERPIIGLQLLHEVIGDHVGNVEAWILGGQIALSRVEFLEFAGDWTGEAIKHFPDNPVIVNQRAETLLMQEQSRQALALFEKAPRAGGARHVAASAICRLVNDLDIPTEPHEAVSAEFLRWYRAFLAAGSSGLVTQINQRLDRVQASFPEAGRALQTALQEAAGSPG